MIARLTLPFVSLLVFGAASACATDIGWVFSQQPSETVWIHARIKAGNCTSGEILHDTLFDATGTGVGADSPSLDSGSYCFRGWALDAECNVLGWGETLTSLPRDSAIGVSLNMIEDVPPIGTGLCDSMGPPPPPPAGSALPIWPHSGASFPVPVDDAVSLSLMWTSDPAATGYTVNVTADRLDGTSPVSMDYPAPASGAATDVLSFPSEILDLFGERSLLRRVRVTWSVTNDSGGSGAVQRVFYLGSRSNVTGASAAEVFASSALRQDIDGIIEYSEDGALLGALALSTDCAEASGFGFAIATEDLNEDGLGELYVGAPGCDGTGAVIRFTFAGPSGSVPTGERIMAPAGATEFGYSLAAVGDTDGDMRPEIAVGAPGGSGGVYLIEGSGEVSRVDAAPGDTGLFVTGDADLDSDGLPELIVGDPAGATILYSGDRLDERIAGVSTAAGIGGYRNGLGAVLVASRESQTIELYSQMEPGGELIPEVFPAPVGDLVSITVASIGDIDADGGGDAAYATVVSGINNTVVLVQATGGASVGRMIDDGFSDEFGYSIAGGGDVDRDGRSDFVVGDPSNNEVTLFVGPAGSILSSVDGDQRGARVDL